MELEGGLPDFVKKEFYEYLKCGILAHGFLRAKCEECDHEKLVAFSCKRRGFCPSCGARRMAETAAHLVDHVIPHEPIRQWVLSFPFQLRYLFASHPKVMSEVLRITNRVIETFLTKKTGLTKKTSQAGAVTLIQRFGGAINLNIHFHTLFLDGVYTFDNNRAKFHQTPPPTGEELDEVLATISRRVARYLEKKGYLVKEDDEALFRVEEEESAFKKLQAASTTYRLAFGPRKGQKVFTLKSLPNSNSQEQKGLVAKQSGFSLHAGTVCEKYERAKLEQLCRYISRSAVAEDRLRLSEKGGVIYKLKKPYDDGTTHVVFTPEELLGRLASLVPKPRVNLTRFYGVFAPHAKHRSLITPTPKKLVEQKEKDKPAEKNKGRMRWAQLLKRVFDIDIEKCPDCGGKVKIIAAIEDPAVKEKILTHLGLDASPPTIWPARAPPLIEHSQYSNDF